MKNFYLLFISFLFLTGCAQNVAFLGPAFSIVKGGGIQQALVSETVNYSIKKNTGKNISEHVMNSVNKESNNQECKDTHGNILKGNSLNILKNIDCKKIK